ncbi:MAG: Ig-like domain-containing protein [Gemmatimonadaceae bacterium]
MKRISVCLIATLLLPSCMTSADGKETLYPAPLVLTELKVTLAHASLFVGQKTTAVATGTDQFANPIATGPVTYLSNSSAATITQDGFITTVAPGKVTITAATATKHAETLLSIAAPVALASMQITLPNSSVHVGETATASIVGKDQYGANFALSNLAWSTSSASVATVLQSGVVTGVAVGQTIITAASQGISTTLAISVVAATPVGLSVTLAGERRVKVGDPYVYTSTISMLDGTIAKLPFSYSVFPSDAGSITQSGVLTALRAGTIFINTTVNGVAYPTTVNSYDWGSTQSTAFTNASLSADSASTATGQQFSPNPSLSISCSGYADPLHPDLNVGMYLNPLIGAGSDVQYSVDSAPLKNDVWPGPITVPGLISYLYPASTNVDRVAFVRAVANGKTLKFTFSQSPQGPVTMSFRLTGMSAAIAPVLAACGIN